MARWAGRAQRCQAHAILLVVAFTVSQAQTLEGDPQGSYRGAYGSVVCDAGVTLSPKTTEWVAFAVRRYASDAARAGKDLKIRASRHGFHSSTPLACPDQLAPLPAADAIGNATSLATRRQGGGRGGGRGVMAVAILQDRIDDVIAWDPAALKLTVGAGMTVAALLREAAQRNASVMVGALPAFSGLTVGGVLSAGGHGTGDMTISTLADMVTEVTFVDGSGAVQKATNPSPEFNAVSAGLGLAGIVTEVTLRLTAPTNTKLITRYLASDADLAGDIPKMLQHAPHVVVSWRPDFHLYTGYMLKAADPVAVPATPGGAKMSLAPPAGGVTRGMADLIDGWQADVFASKEGFLGSIDQERLICPSVALGSVAKAWASTADGKPVLYGVAPTNDMEATGCGDGCGWDGPQSNTTTEDVHFAIEMEQLPAWIADVSAIFEKDLLTDNRLGGPKCMGPGYIWLRFGYPRGEYLHMGYGMRRPVYVQSTWLRSTRTSDAPVKFGWVADLIEELTLCKYGGRPHWGKNHPRTLLHPKCPIAGRYPALGAQLAAQARYDPKKVFEPRLFSQILSGNPGYDASPGCALSKECFCASDAHCNRRGAAAVLACAPSNAFPEYRVCKPNWRAYDDKVGDLREGLMGGAWKRYRLSGNPLTKADDAAAQALLGFRP